VRVQQFEKNIHSVPKFLMIALEHVLLQQIKAPVEMTRRLVVPRSEKRR
jgi:hypothetical protein